MISALCLRNFDSPPLPIMDTVITDEFGIFNLIENLKNSAPGTDGITRNKSKKLGVCEYSKRSNNESNSLLFDSVFEFNSHYL